MTDYPGTIFPKYFINKKLSCTWGPQCAEAGCYKKKKGSIVDSSNSKKLDEKANGDIWVPFLCFLTNFFEIFSISFFTPHHSPYIRIVLYRVTLVQDPVLALRARTTLPRAQRRARA